MKKNHSTILALAGAGLICTCCTPQEAPDNQEGNTEPSQPETPTLPEKPNIIIIMTDDMGYSDIGCFGSEIPTPNIDALAERGIRYRSFFNNSRSAPTRASLLPAGARSSTL